MRKILIKNLIPTFVALFLSSVSMAQTLVPATSEDLSEFDSQINQAHKSSTDSQFGAKISEEARNLQNSTAQKKKARKGALDPRDQAERASLGAGGNSGNSDKDAKVSSPKNSDRGNSANAPGHNKNK
ncbi:MAG: hypothetical protein JSU04_10825 [Bdellovibrionales bacterium]|nr:hypothetical protein [Bdellovibrionales bacterium]